MINIDIQLKDMKKGSYSDEKFCEILSRLVIADKNKLIDWDTLSQIRQCIDRAMLKHLKQAIEKYFNNCSKFEVISFYKSNNWIECIFSDTNITYEISISTDRDGNYYLLSNDNIRRVENKGDYRFSIKEIQEIQDGIKEISHQVFNKFNVKYCN